MGCRHSNNNSNNNYTENDINMIQNDYKKIKFFNCDDMSGKCYVCYVYDGDTCHVAFKWNGVLYRKKVRLAGIDTPELKTKNATEKIKGIEARDYVKSICLGKIVWCVFDGDDKYGRALGTIYLTENDYNLKSNSLNQQLIDKKMAVAYDGGTKAEWNFSD